MFRVLAIFLFFVGLEAEAATAQWDTTYGTLEGYSVNGANNVPVSVFKSVPFARPPVGRRRFARPEPPERWTRPRDATHYSAACLSNSTIRSPADDNMSEDCLYLNVFADSRCTDIEPCPVAVFIHGGAFKGDGATMFNDSFLIQNYASDRMIFVIPAYRLGIFGFLDLGEELSGAPFNVGMWDLIAALKFVRNEIPFIGGNRDEVTVFGYSSGSTMIDYLLLSPKVPTELFKRALISSGCLRLTPHYNLRMGRTVAEKVECNSTQLDDQLMCLRRRRGLSISAAMVDPLSERPYLNVGAQSDKFLFPATSSGALRDHWKSKPIIFFSTTGEMGELEANRPLEEVCGHYAFALGYVGTAIVNECVRYYTQRNWTKTIYRDVVHGANVLLGKWNIGSPTYQAVFGQPRQTKHTADIVNIVGGLHRKRPELNAADLELQQWMVDMAKRWFRNGSQPADEWPVSDPTTQSGYLYIELLYDSKNQTLRKPQFRPNQFYNPEAVDFWVRRLQEVNSTTKPSFRPFWRSHSFVSDSSADDSAPLVVETDSVTNAWMYIFGSIALALCVYVITLAVSAIRSHAQQSQYNQI